MNGTIVNKLKTIAGACAILIAASAAQAQDADAEEMTAIIQAIEYGWEHADGAPFRKHFLDFDGARYVESGGQNVGLSDLIDHHVEPEGDALDGLELNFSNIETHVEGQFAWAVADVEVIAVVKSDGRKIHNRGYETFLFRRIGSEWKVVHTHSSSRPVKVEEPEHKH
tara:strand:+ start:13927 stop:14430 length:504 start_codon:yes stop_codon:yes gene_type:complete